LLLRLHERRERGFRCGNGQASPTLRQPALGWAALVLAVTHVRSGHSRTASRPTLASPFKTLASPFKAKRRAVRQLDH
jgi:hypothetical protein